MPKPHRFMGSSRALFRLIILKIWVFDLSEVGNAATIVCPLEFAIVERLLSYRYQLVCNNFDFDECSFSDISKSDTYSSFVILVHHDQWKMVEIIANHFSRCNIPHIMFDTSAEAELDLTLKCSTAITTIVFSITNTSYGMGEITSKQIDCVSVKKEVTTLKLLSSTCPNTVWITGSNDCNSSMIHYGTNVLRNNNELDIIGDRTFGKSYIKNKHLRIGVRIDAEYVIATDTNRGVDYDGLLIQLLEKFAENLQFTYEIIPPPDRFYGAPTNNTYGWNGLVRQLLANEIDMAVADFTITPARSKVIDFSASYYFEVYSIMIKHVKAETNLWGLFSLFSKEAWVMIFISAIVAAMVVFLLHKFSAIRLESVFNRLSACGWYVFCCLSNQGSQYDSVPCSARIFMSIWLIFVVALLSMYSGSLMAMLSSNYISLPFKDIAGLAELVAKGKYKVCTMSGSGLWGTIMADDQTDENYRIFRDFFRRNPQYGKSDVFVCMNSLIDNSDVAYVGERAHMEAFQREHCNEHLVILDDKFFPGFFGFGFQKHSFYNAIISQQIIQAVEAGLVTGLKKKYQQGLAFCDIIPPDQLPTVATNVLLLLNFTAPYILFFVGSAASIFAFCFERYRFKISNHH